MKKGIKAEELNLKQLISLKSFREPRQATIGSDGLTECPTCHGYIDVEYVRYCSRCGQRLVWDNWHRAMMQQEWREDRERWARAKKNK